MEPVDNNDVDRIWTETVDHIWRDMAVERYGSAIVSATSHLYGGSYRAMVRDDNVLGAVPALTLGPKSGGALPCPWKRNKPTYFFLCLLIELKFHRKDNELRLYLDARGERDLRHPGDSTIECIPDASTVTGNEPSLITGTFVSEISMPGHHKGYLSFDAGQFSKAGKYYFTFADPRQMKFYRMMRARLEAMDKPRNAVIAPKDYESVLLLEVPFEGGLVRAFANIEGTVRYSLPSSPFEGETEDDERRRFAPYTADSLLKRHELAGGKRKWWVSPNDQGIIDEPQRVLLALIGPLRYQKYKDDV